MNSEKILRLIQSKSDDDYILAVELLMSHSELEIEDFFQKYGIEAQQDKENRLSHTDWFIELPNEKIVPQQYQLKYLKKGKLYICLQQEYLIMDYVENAKTLIAMDNGYSILTEYE